MFIFQLQRLLINVLRSFNFPSDGEVDNTLYSCLRLSDFLHWQYLCRLNLLLQLLDLYEPRFRSHLNHLILEAQAFVL